MIHLREIAKRLSQNLVIWSAAGNHPALAQEAFWVVVLLLLFWNRFLGGCSCICSPGLSLFLDESAPCAERRSLSAWLPGCCIPARPTPLNNSSVSTVPPSKSQDVLMITLLQEETNFGRKMYFIPDMKKALCSFSELPDTNTGNRSTR